MSTDAGAAGAFGLLLSEYPDVKSTYDELVAYVQELKDKYDEDEAAQEVSNFDPESEESAPRINEFRDRLIEEFAKLNIVVPPNAYLLWTGSEDDRPASCETPADDWILGFGLFTAPWSYPVMEESFRESAVFHNWVWMG